MRARTNNALPVIAAMLAAHAASGDVLVDNLGEPTRAATVLGTIFPDNIWAAQAFSGPECSTLDSIEALLGDASDPPDAIAQLRAGSDPSGPVLATFTVPPLPPVGAAVITLIPDAPVTIEPGETYWLVLGTSTTGAFSWSYAEGNGSAGPGSLGAFAYSEDQGATWGPLGAKNPHQIRVNVTPGCACPADINGDGVLTLADFVAFRNLYVIGDLAADFDGSGGLTLNDFVQFRNAYVAGCP